jgi:hypothetical protein
MMAHRAEGGVPATRADTSPRTTHLGCSGLERTATSAGIFHVRDSKITRIVVYFDSKRALADLGLTSEEARDPR